MQGELFIFASLAIADVFGGCRPTNLQIINLQRPVKRSIPQTVQVIATKCPGMNKLYYWWDFLTYVTRQAHPVEPADSFMTINGYWVSLSVVYKGEFELRATVSHYKNGKYNASTWQRFYFLPDEMHIEIAGGNEKTHPAQLDLIVDAEKFSRDTSFTKEENPFEGDTINWVMKPQVPAKFYSPLVFRVSWRDLKCDSTYYFEVTVRRYKIPLFFDKQSAHQLVRIVNKTLPDLLIECSWNCVRPNPREKTRLVVVCRSNCDQISGKYVWTVKPSIPPSQMDLGTGYDMIVIGSDVFTINQTVEFTVSVDAALAKYNLSFQNWFKMGSCDISPKSGTSGVTKFNVNCQGFSSPAGGLAYSIFQETDKEKSAVMVNQGNLPLSNDFLLAPGSPAVVVVKVQDGAFMEYNLYFNVDVKPFLAGANDTYVRNTIKTLVLDDTPNSIISLSIEQSRNKAIQLMTVLLNAMENAKNLGDSVKRDLHKHMGESLLRLDAQSHQSAKQIFSMATHLLKLKLATDTHTSRLLSRVVKRMTITLHKVGNHKANVFLPSFFVKEFTERLFEASSSLILEIQQLEVELNEVTEVHDYESYDEMVSRKLEVRDNLRSVTESVLIALHVACTTALSFNLPGEKAVTFDSKAVTFTTRKVLTTNMENKISLPLASNSTVVLPKAFIRKLVEKSEEIDYQFGVFKKNPFWWHRLKPEFATDLVVFDLFHRCKKAKPPKSGFLLRLLTDVVPVGTITGSTTGESPNVHQLEVNPGSTVVIVFQPANETYTAAAATHYCRKKDFSMGIKVKQGTSDYQRTLSVKSEHGERFIYVCVQSEGGETLEYTARFSSFTCISWDLKTNRWISDGCEVLEATLKNQSVMVCRCTHTSVFAGTVLVPPNKLNINRKLDFHMLVEKNWVMVTFVATTFFLWIFLLLWAHVMDKKFRKRCTVHKLDDNIPGDRHAYLVVVLTGFFIDAGTTADVAFQLVGEKAKSRVHLIKSFPATLLQRNMQDWFIINTPCELGPLRRLRLWHNCKGGKPHWYCQRVIVKHMKSGDQYCFIVEKWFSLIWGDGKIHREVKLMDEDQLKCPKVLLSVKLVSHFFDRHTWVSVFMRHPQSNFSSKERVSTAFASIFLSMLASAMFYGMPKNTAADSINRTATYSVTYYEVVVFFETLLVTLPVITLVFVLFKNSAPKTRLPPTTRVLE